MDSIAGITSPGTRAPVASAAVIPEGRLSLARHACDTCDIQHTRRIKRREHANGASVDQLHLHGPAECRGPRSPGQSGIKGQKRRTTCATSTSNHASDRRQAPPVTTNKLSMHTESMHCRAVPALLSRAAQGVRTGLGSLACIVGWCRHCCPGLPRGFGPVSVP